MASAGFAKRKQFTIGLVDKYERLPNGHSSDSTACPKTDPEVDKHMWLRSYHSQNRKVCRTIHELCSVDLWRTRMASPTFFVKTCWGPPCRILIAFSKTCTNRIARPWQLPSVSFAASAGAVFAPMASMVRCCQHHRKASFKGHRRRLLSKIHIYIYIGSVKGYKGRIYIYICKEFLYRALYIGLYI